MKGSQEEETHHQPQIVDQEHPKTVGTEHQTPQPPSSSPQIVDQEHPKTVETEHQTPQPPSSSPQIVDQEHPKTVETEHQTPQPPSSSPQIVDQELPKSIGTEHQTPQPPSSSSPDQEATDPKKWGTHVMGAPAAPVAHPDNQQAAAWVAGDNQQTQHQPYIIYSPVEHPPTNHPLEPVIGMFHTWSRKAETVARNLWHNLNTGPSMPETAWGKINLTAKAITKGGFESLFRQIFGTEPNEKLKKTFACYLSTTTGPVAGTLYLSNSRVAFCSDRPLFFTAPSGQEAWSYYRVVVPLVNVGTVNPVVMKETPPEKYIQVTTVDGHDFWFMGFVNYEKATHHLLTSVSDSQTAHSSVSS